MEVTENVSHVITHQSTPGATIVEDTKLLEKDIEKSVAVNDGCDINVEEYTHNSGDKNEVRSYVEPAKDKTNNKNQSLDSRLATFEDKLSDQCNGYQKQTDISVHNSDVARIKENAQACVAGNNIKIEVDKDILLEKLDNAGNGKVVVDNCASILAAVSTDSSSSSPQIAIDLSYHTDHGKDSISRIEMQIDNREVENHNSSKKQGSDCRPVENNDISVGSSSSQAPTNIEDVPQRCLEEKHLQNDVSSPAEETTERSVTPIDTVSSSRNPGKQESYSPTISGSIVELILPDDDECNSEIKDMHSTKEDSRISIRSQEGDVLELIVEEDSPSSDEEGKLVLNLSNVSSSSPGGHSPCPNKQASTSLADCDKTQNNLKLIKCDDTFGTSSIVAGPSKTISREDPSSKPHVTESKPSVKSNDLGDTSDSEADLVIDEAVLESGKEAKDGTPNKSSNKGVEIISVTSKSQDSTDSEKGLSFQDEMMQSNKAATTATTSNVNAFVTNSPGPNDNSSILSGIFANPNLVNKITGKVLRKGTNQNKSKNCPPSLNELQAKTREVIEKSLQELKQSLSMRGKSVMRGNNLCQVSQVPADRSEESNCSSAAVISIRDVSKAVKVTETKGKEGHTVISKTQMKVGRSASSREAQTSTPTLLTEKPTVLQNRPQLKKLPIPPLKRKASNILLIPASTMQYHPVSLGSQRAPLQLHPSTVSVNMPQPQSNGPRITSVIGSYKEGSQSSAISSSARSLPTTSNKRLASKTLILPKISSRLSMSKFTQHMTPWRKPYRPQPPPACLDLTTATFPCFGCGDTFIMKSSLEAHLARRSILIKEFCGVCSLHITYYNPCTRYTHLKSHFSGCVQLLGDAPHFEVLPKHSMTKSAAFVIPPPPETLGDDEINIFNSDGDVRNTTRSAISDPPAAVSAAPVSCPASPRRSSQEKRSYFSALELEKTVETSTKPVTPQLGDGNNLTPIQSRRFTCTHCRTRFPNAEDLAIHYTTVEANDLYKRQCQKCKWILPNQCSQVAHTRLHKQKELYVCPECGICMPTWSTLATHLRKRCFHYHRQMKIPCSLCSKSFDTLSAMHAHLINTHSEVYHKCCRCQMAFKSRDSYIMHARAAHAVDNPQESDMTTIYKCPLCDIISSNSQRLAAHVPAAHDKALFDSVQFRFKCWVKCEKRISCPFQAFSLSDLWEHRLRFHCFTVPKHMCDYCNMIFEEEDSLADHRNVVHMTDMPFNALTLKPLQGSPESDQHCSTDVLHSETDRPKKAFVKKKKSYFGCVHCKLGFSRKEDFMEHMLKHKTNLKNKSPLKLKRVDKSRLGKFRFKADPGFTKNKEKSMRTIRSLGPKKMVDVESFPDTPCPQCGEVFFSQNEVEAHMADKHQVSPQFPCHLCGLTYSTDKCLRQHMKMKHEGKPKDHHFACWLCAEKNIHKGYPRSFMLKQHLTSFHKVSRSGIDYAKLQGSLDDECETGGDLDGEPPVKRLKRQGDNDFTCAKCDFTCATRQEFSEHIPSHKTLAGSLQCQECGLCFSVYPSLKRHLLVVHRIRNLEKYNEEVGTTVKSPPKEMTRSGNTPVAVNGVGGGAVDKATSSGSVQELECRVCYKKFVDEGKMRHHMRTHGMAFIRSRRMTNNEEIL